MSKQIPESHKDLLENPIVATLTTVSDQGQPQSTVVWKKYDGKTIQFSTLADRKKTLNINDNPNVSVMVIDPQNPYRYIEVRGTAEIDQDGGIALADELTKMYMGKEHFYGDVAPAEKAATDHRVVIKVTPEHVIAY